MELIHSTNAWAPIMSQSPWEVLHKKGIDRASQLQDVEGHRSRDITVPSGSHYDQRSPGCSRGTLGVSRPAEDFQKDVQVEMWRTRRSQPPRMGNCASRTTRGKTQGKESLVHPRHWEHLPWESWGRTEVGHCRRRRGGGWRCKLGVWT